MYVQVENADLKHKVYNSTVQMKTKLNAVRAYLQV